MGNKIDLSYLYLSREEFDRWYAENSNPKYLQRYMSYNQSEVDVSTPAVEASSTTNGMNTTKLLMVIAVMLVVPPLGLFLYLWYVFHTDLKKSNK